MGDVVQQLIRSARGLPVFRIAKEAGVPNSTASDILNGKRPGASANIVAKLMAATEKVRASRKRKKPTAPVHPRDEETQG